jgi:rSAM/selenodomain-associated transferase 1
MVKDTWETACNLEDVEPVLFVDELAPEFETLANGRLILTQEGHSLGTRMHQCFQHLASCESIHNIIIGTDSPTLPSRYLNQAFSQLQGDADAVLGPTEDGGYYLVGCRQPRSNMFNNVTWSTAQTLSQTRRAFDDCGWKTEYTPVWWDVDTPSDVERLARDKTLGANVRDWFARAGKFPADKA